MNEQFNPSQPSDFWVLLGLDELQFTSGEPSFRVVLDAGGPDKGAVIRELRGIFGYHHIEARIFIESAPKEMERDVTFWEAARWISRLSFVGCASHIKELQRPHNLALCHQLAQHKDLPRELALYFLLCGDETLTRLVAQSPHHTRESLSLVATLAPAHFVENPILPLLLLEDPNLQQLDERALTLLLKQEGALPMLYPAALSHQASSIALASGDLELLPREVVEALSRSNDWGVQFKLAHNPAAPLWVLERLASSERDRIPEAVAMHAATTPELLARLSDSIDKHTLVAVASNDRTPTKIIERLSTHELPEVVRAVARNPGTPAERLLALAQDADEEMLRALYRNPSVPTELLKRELSKESRDLLLLVTNNEAALPEVLGWLYERTLDEVLRFSILRNKRCSEALRQRGLREESQVLRDAAAGLI